MSSLYCVTWNKRVMAIVGLNMWSVNETSVMFENNGTTVTYVKIKLKTETALHICSHTVLTHVPVITWARMCKLLTSQKVEYRNCSHPYLAVSSIRTKHEQALENTPLPCCFRRYFFDNLLLKFNLFIHSSIYSFNKSGMSLNLTDHGWKSKLTSVFTWCNQTSSPVVG